MSRRWFLVLTCALLFLGAEAVVSAASVRTPKYSVRTWDTDDGLPSGSILSMAQTPDGYLWLGTMQGLARFDGVGFKVFDVENTPGLPENQIHHLFAGRNGNLWIGTANAGTVFYRDGRIVAPPELSAGGSERRLRAACEDASGAVWLQNANGELWRFAEGRFTPFVLPVQEESRWRSLIRETNGTVWVGSDRRQWALGQVGENGSLILPVREEVTAILLNALVPSRQGGYWRLGDFRIQRWVSNRLDQDVSPFPVPGLFPTAASEDREGNLILGYEGRGVIVVSPQGEFTGLTTAENLSHNWVRSVLVDRDGTLWVGTDGGGLNRVRRQAFSVIEETHRKAVYSVAQDGRGGLWIGTVRDAFGYWLPGATNQYEQFQGSLGFSGNSIRSLLPDRDGRLWLATEGGELFMGGGRRLERTSADGRPLGMIRAIYQDRRGGVWFGSSLGLLHRTEAGWERFTTKEGLGADAVTCLTEDSGGEIWVGTLRGGIFRKRDDRFVEVGGLSGHTPEDIQALLVDNEGVLWATTAGDGLWHYHRGRWTRLTTEQGLPSNRLGFMLEDREGNLWLGSNKGLLRLAKRSVGEVAQGSSRTVSCRVYRKEDGLGLPTSECSAGSQPGAWLGADGTLWFSTSKGVVYVNPAQLPMNTNPPPVNIESVSVDEQPRKPELVEGRPTLVLGPGDERLVIQYSSLNLGAPDSARFRHRLEGHQKDWQEAGNERFASYLKLPAGQYTFRVSAASEEGVWNETGASLMVLVRPPLWQEWWFITLMVLTVFGLVAGIVHYLSTQRLQRQLAGLRQQEALQKERARIARDIHDQVGASLTQVALLGELVETDKDSPLDVEEHGKLISQTARETTRALDEIVWTVNPQNDTLEGLVNYICKNAQDYLAVAGVRYRFEVPSEMPPRAVAPEVRHNAFLASKEAVTNVVRHAKATSAWIRVRVEPATVVVEVEDNGKGVAGLDVNAPRTRNGLKNMRKRMEDIGGTFSITPGNEGGALVRLTFPLS